MQLVDQITRINFGIFNPLQIQIPQHRVLADHGAATLAGVQGRQLRAILYFQPFRTIKRRLLQARTVNEFERTAIRAVDVTCLTIRERKLERAAVIMQDQTVIDVELAQGVVIDFRYFRLGFIPLAPAIDDQRRRPGLV